MPKMDAEMREGMIAEWLKKEGDRVEKEEPIAMVEGAKVMFELKSDMSGILKKILAQPGAVVPVGQPVAIIAEG